MINKTPRFLSVRTGLRVKISVLSLAAAAMTVFSVPPALAGGGHGIGGHVSFRDHSDFRGGYYRRNSAYYSGGRRYYGRHYRGGRRGYSHGYGRISGGEGLLIAAGIIGGVILIDRAIEADRREYYERRRYEDRYDRDRWYDRRSRDRVFEDDDPYYRRDDRDLDLRGQEGLEDGTTPAPNDLDKDLLGGKGGSVGYTIQAAFTQCAAEARGAAGASGLMVALPAEPTSVEKLENGSMRLTTEFTAQNPRGRQWRRTMICEADASGISFLEIA